MNLNQITLPVSDTGRSADFYQRLGLRLIVDSIPRYARLECPDGESTLSLHHCPDPISGPGAWLYFEVTDLDRTVLRLKDAGFRFDSEPEDKNWLWREARLRDPDGHVLVLFYAGKNRKFPPWRLD